MNLWHPRHVAVAPNRGEKAQTSAVMTRVSASKEMETRSVSRRSFSITPVPPFRLDLTAWALRRRPENAIDRWDGTTYQRVLMIDRQAVDVAVHQSGGPEEPQLEVELTGSRLTVQQEDFARMSLERMLGVHRDLKPFYRLATRDPRLQLLADEFRGLKPPQFPTVFEAVANGIACQQLSLLVGILLLSRLAHAVGEMSANSKDASHAFPDPTDFHEVTVQSLKVLGFSANKSQALLDVSSAVRDRRLDLESLVHFDNQSALERLVKLKGVGRWTAEYVLLRGLGRLDIFPGDDVGARKKLAHFLRKKKTVGLRRGAQGRCRLAALCGFRLFPSPVGSHKEGWMAVFSSCPAWDQSRSSHGYRPRLENRAVIGKDSRVS